MKMKTLVAGILASSAATFVPATPAAAQDFYLGQMMLVPYNFCPRSWSTAAGQTLSIAQNSALFALLGTTYGGNGQTTFQLPNLQSRTVIGHGQGTGLQFYSLGQVGGTENTTLTIQNMPIHNHTATATSLIKVAAGQVADTPNPLRNSFATTGTNNTYYTGAPTANYMDNDNVATTVTVAQNGGSQPFSIVQPYLTLQWCIATEGIFPSRN